MNSKIIFYLVCFCLVSFSCMEEQLNENIEYDFTDTTEFERITTVEAQDLIRLWIFNDYNPDMNPSMTFSVDEITTDDMVNKLKAQVFIVISQVPGLDNRALFIKNKKVYDLGRQNLMGALKPENFIVTDLNNDKHYELCFILIHGSGIVRTDVACFIFDLKDKFLFADTSYPFITNLKLEQENYQNVFLKQMNQDNEVNMGKVVLVKENNILRVKVIK